MKIFFETFANNKNPFSYSSKLRRDRFNKFVKILALNQDTRILDVGGTADIWLGSGFEKNVTILNIGSNNSSTTNIKFVQGDACNIEMFQDKEFDVIYSNSVIEHVGDLNRQQLFAHEIKRVTKKYWIQTPYKHFPIEPHFLFPFFQYFPQIILI